MPNYISVLKLSGKVNWKIGNGAPTQLQTCKSFNIADTAIANFHLKPQNASVEIHQFSDTSAFPFCPIPHNPGTLLMFLDRDALKIKKRRVTLRPKSRKAQGAKRKFTRSNPQIIVSDNVTLTLGLNAS